ncbi:hypothetical protein, partial [Salmonella enterica]|uniref:hypothetical protein n=1 Tax=Salmonella enterica TaxID=28901 RepID=UPI001591C1C7
GAEISSLVEGSDRFSPLRSGGVLTLTAISSPVVVAADVDACGLSLVTVVGGDGRDVPLDGISLSVGARYFLALM